jgi:hypothetical protein
MRIVKKKFYRVRFSVSESLFIMADNFSEVEKIAHPTSHDEILCIEKVGECLVGADEK